MWIVRNIMEADYGCEERMPGEPEMVIVTLENDEDGRMSQFQIANEWLLKQEIDEGDEWPEDLDSIDEEAEKAKKMAAFMETFFGAMDEMKD